MKLKFKITTDALKLKFEMTTEIEPTARGVHAWLAMGHLYNGAKLCQAHPQAGSNKQRLGSYYSKLQLNKQNTQEEEPPDTGGGRVFSFDATSGLLATASASALALSSALGSAFVV